jgi:hypothetical protein
LRPLVTERPGRTMPSPLRSPAPMVSPHPPEIPSPTPDAQALADETGVGSSPCDRVARHAPTPFQPWHISSRPTPLDMHD